MLIRSTGYALSWEYWRRGVWWFVPACAASVAGFLAPAYGVLMDSPEVRVELNHAVFATIWWVPLVFAMASRATLRRLYTLPLSTQSLVNWTLANGAVAVLATYWLVALSINGLFRADWPLLLPAWWAVVIYVVFQATVWSIDKGRGFLLIPAVSFGLLVIHSTSRELFERLVPGGRSFDGDGVPHVWPAVVFDLAAPLVVGMCFYLAAIHVVRRDRRGKTWSLAWLSPGRWTRRRAEPPSRTVAEQQDFATHRFRSPYSAQFWLEWRSRGRYLPLSVAAILCILWTSFALMRSDGRSISEALAGLCSTALFFSPFVGLFLGHRSDRFDMKSFLATRPLSDGDLAMSVLGNTAAAIGASATIWSIGVLATVAVCDCPPPIPDWRVVPMLLLCAWTWTGLGLTLGLARSWFIPVVGGALGIFLVLSFWLLNAFRSDEIELFLMLAFLLCCFGGTALTFVAAVRRQILSRRSLLGCLTGYLALLAWSYSTRDAAGMSLWGHLLLIGLCAVPFAPLAAAPLALSWNRHR